jgi:hypothetical protein
MKHFIELYRTSSKLELTIITIKIYTTMQFKRVLMKVMPPISLRWPMMLERNAGGR